ncbi:MAG: hypothetical protein EP346_03575 [Bacteroidetes bacterium]|nr:MAG: hypothetical protein EP346_03575 [Bacteroidota bacterium]
MPRHYFLLSFLLLFCISNAGMGQTEPKDKPNSIGVLIGHSIIPKGAKNGITTAIITPSWAIDYNYALPTGITLGWHNEIIIESFEYESTENQGIVIERSRPIASCITAGYQYKSILAYIGGGLETAKEGNYGLFRIGADYSLEMRWDMEFVMAVNWDLKVDAYDSYGISAGIAKRF